MAEDIKVVIAEENREIVEKLRGKGIAAASGVATEAGVLIQAHIQHARLLVLSPMDILDIHKIVDIAKTLNPQIQVLVCAERGDTEVQADKLLAKLLKLRIFRDDAGKMNRSVQDMGGGLLLVSQFTLAADTAGGNRPSFTGAAAPDEGLRLYNYVVQQARTLHSLVQTGRFAEDMQVTLTNDGPVTIPLQVR